MKVKELKALIKYWPNEGEVMEEYGWCPVEESDIYCVATESQWQDMYNAEYNELTEIISCMERALKDTTLTDISANSIKRILKRDKERIEELKKLMNAKESQ